MKTLNIILLVVFLPLLFYGSPNIKIETNTVQEIGINQEFKVNISLHKSDINGFAKLEVIFPCNIEVNAIEYSSALFINKSNSVKFIWIDIPREDIINLLFTVKILYYTERKIEIISKFNFLKENTTQTVVNKENLLVIPDLLSNAKKSLLTKEKINLSTKEIKRRILFELNTKLEKDLVYHVQIAALKSNLNERVLKELVDDNFEIKETFENGYHKYYIGNFYSLEVATMFKEYCGVKDAFVIPVFNGERITINDAKEIIKNKEISDKY